MLELDLSRIESAAVVGASRDKNKYGYKVLRDLIDNGYEAYAVNPSCPDIDGSPCYPDLSSLPKTPDLVITVVPPPVTEKVVEEAGKLGIDKIWMQPGSESEYAISYAEERGIGVVHHACIMIYRREGVLREGHRP